MSAVKKQPTVKKGAGIAYRIIAAIVALACIGAFFLPISFFVDHFFGKGLSMQEIKLFEIFEHIDLAPYKFLSVIPVFTTPDTFLGLVAGLIPYILALALAIAFILAFISIFLGRKAKNLLFVATIIFTWGAAIYMIAVVSITCYLPKPITFDLCSTVLASIGTLAFLAILIVKLGVKTTILNSVRFLLTLCFAACLLLSLAYEYHLVRGLLSKNKLYEIMPIAIVALAIANLIAASMRAFKKKAFAFDFISSILSFLVASALFVLSVISSIHDSMLLLFCDVARLIAVVLFLLAFINVNLAKKKAAIAVARANAEPKETVTEEPTAKPAPAVKAAPAEPEKDYFEGKLVDDFIETLNVSERNEFASVYLLNKSEMPEIPEYKIGRNNQYFFETVFIMLGDYRDKVSKELLGKMYNFFCSEYPQTKVPAYKA